MARKRKINHEDTLKILKDYQRGLSCEKIAINYNVVDITIRNLLLRNGVILRPSRSKGSTRSKLSNKEILKQFSSGKSIKEIAVIADVKERAIWNRLKRMGVKFPRKVTRKYSLNEEFFNSWSYQMAYILGFIYSDGCISRNRQNLYISQKEKPILVNIAKCLELPEECVVNRKNHYYLTVNSVKLCRSLCWHGVIPNKSLRVDFPYVPKRYMGAFLRGVIDGDGWVDKKSYRVVVYTGSENFAIGLNKAFLERGLNARIRRDKRGLYCVTVSTKQNVLMLGDLIYKNKGELYLKRKHERFYLSE
ncbi:LAGLIDADG family homing endonuclease [Bacillus sp. 31A1R]|uniref:LAGLIDADG family homing endonuclease n=1 Tax=Robertmurraya mangrovi TaxID=3098077 RepID=A0ABU5J403_9BACI|nr:LAGLIDADG family homing endonuclease [Bacillus sp. 31A1R]MDZ5474155.1 LAGLIDADG family homing endonuclease [Bacillus sp. 31A1R]